LGISYEYFKTFVLLHQSVSASELVHGCHMENANPCFTPMEEGHEHKGDWKNPDDARVVEVHPYQVLAGMLIWLLQTRADLCYTINVLCTAMSKPAEGDVKRLKRLARYIKHTLDRGLQYHRALDITVEAISYCYVDASFELTSVSGVALFIGQPDRKTHINKNAAIMFLTKIEKVAVTSTMDAEILAIERGIVALEWLAQYREEIGYPQTQRSVLFTDSASAIAFINNTQKTPNRQTRHIRRRVRKIRANVVQNHVVLEHVPGALNCADVLTKPLGRVLHWKHSNNLQGYPAAE
jgi:hypothetical protein